MSLRKVFLIPPPRWGRRGGGRESFTLIEMLLVVSLMAMTGLAVYNVIASGLKIWERSQRYTVEEDAAIFFEKLTRDLKNSYPYSLIKFSGTGVRMSIPTLVNMPVDKKIAAGRPAYIEQMGCVEYFWDQGRQALSRRQANYSQALGGHFDRGTVLVKPVQGLRFLYLYREENEIRKKKTADGALPVAVEVSLLLGDQTEPVKTMTRQINLPRGQ